ncbi:hypothetical protein BCR36DRAFT_254242, partial [Piromyces finnis]
ERKYSTFDRELLALSETLLHYKLLLRQGQKIYTATDHKNLAIYINSGSKVETNRKLRLFENIYQEIYKQTLRNLLEGDKRDELEKFVLNQYKKDQILFTALKKQIFDLLKENSHWEEKYNEQRKVERTNQRINDLRYDLNLKAERIELTKKVN